MNPVQESLARIVSVRERWIAINDDTVAPSLLKAIRRIVPIPFLFEVIPFRQHSDDLGQMVAELEQEISTLERYRQSEFADDYNRRVASAAIPFARAIREAASVLREPKKRMADSLDNMGPKYSWSEYNRDLARYELLRPEVSNTGERLSAAINAPTEQATTTKREEVAIEDAVSLFLNSVRQHVENNWQRCADELKDYLPNPSVKLAAFVSGDIAKYLMVHAMFAVELRQARTVYPVPLVQQLETVTFETIRATLGESGDQFVAMTRKFLIQYDDAIEREVPAMWGIGAALAHFTQVNLQSPLSAPEFSDYSKFMFAAADALKLDWWANFASQKKLEVGA